MRICKKGFSLVELFLVTALMGIILAALFSAFTSGIRVWRMAQELKIAQERRFVISTEKMKAELMGYIRDFKEISFEGDKTKLTYPSISPKGIAALTYKIDKAKKALVKEEVKFSDSLKDKMRPKRTRLFSANKAVFSYLLLNSTKTSASWNNSFSTEKDGIPQAIKMEATIDGVKKEAYIFLPQ